MDPILLRGARQNNLKGFDLALSPGEVLVITGRSGAGKSSLALDTLYAEGQRRYIESFSPYARQFLDRSQRPELEELTAALPAIAVDRTAPARSGRSTVATRTEIADHVKLLFARAASGSCQRCGGPVVAQRPESIAAQLLKDHPEQRAVIWLPQGGVDSVEGLLEARDTLLPLGFARVIRGRSFADLDDLRPSDLVEVVHGGELKVVVDRLVLRPSERDRLVEALESALRFGPGELGVDIDGGEAIRTARGWRCERCGRAHQEPSAGLFSFNNPIGACERCSGFGRDVELDPDKVVDDPSKTLDQQALRPFRGPKRDWERAELARLCHRHGIPTDRPWSELSAEHRRLLWHGEGRGRGRWFGVTGWFEWMESRSYKAHVRIQLARYRRYVPCEACGGSRFSPETLRYRLGGLTLPELYGLDCEQARAHLRQLPSRDDPAVAVLLDEILSRLDFLCDVGLSYLSLDRMSRTLSGGEAQRVGLATVLGASLSGTLLVVDEPTAGLHPADVPRLMGVIRRLARAGNALVVVDNHPAVISQADRVADLGPGAGAAGGELVYSGPVAGLAEVDRGATAAMLRPQPAPSPQRREPQRWLTVRGARAHNLRDIDVALPLGLLTVVSGASGSGKSTLVEQVLVRGLLRGRGETTDQPGEHDGIDGGEELTEVVVMDQSPLGRTSRGNPATYVKAWDVLRTRLAKQEAALEAGLSASSFSFNVAGGRCETCRGEGVEVVEMQFLPDIRLPCPSCGGRRFKDEVLAVTFAGRTVAQLLDTTAEELIELCPKDKLLGRRLEPLIAVGLGYLRLGQPLDTLSDGEAQRLKVARSLGTVSEGALVVLDEPTVGLHPADVEPLIAALERLVARGCTVVTVSHDLTLAASADWMIDLGPGGGRDGGQLVASGPPEAVAASEDGRTGSLLRARLAGEPMVLVEDRQLEAPQPSGRRSILVRGARQHNLRHLDLEVPLSEVCVVTGPSGSGKSTLAFDVIHAEGQRRFLQALSPYVRQYLRQLPRPEVDSVDGVPPSIALEPRSTAAGGATVATLTEVGHHLRLLFARAGIQRCPDCQVKAGARTRAEIVEVVSRELERGPRSLLARVIEHRKGTHKDVMGRARTLGLERLRVDGELFPATNPPKLARYREHDVDYEVARLESRAGVDRGVGQALSLGRGTVRLTGGDGELILSTSRSCPSCGRGFPELDPTVFTHHSPHAACPECQGLGWVASIDHEAVFDDDRPLGDGGLRLFAFPAFRRFLGRRLRRITSIPLSKRYGELDDSQRQWLLRGRGRWPGVIQAVAQLDDRGIAAVEGMLTRERCEACGGSRLAPEPRNVILGADDTSFLDVLSQSVSTARRWFEELELGERQRVVGEDLRRQVSRRLAFLEDTGVGYLTLDRPAETLSGGETQRVRLAAQLGSGLTGVCYVLDEPTIGLHPRDTARLISILRRLSTLGASVLVVEHDEQVIRAADHVIDLGPGGGTGGGAIMATGSPEAIIGCAGSATGAMLASPRTLEGRARRDVDGGVEWLRLEGVSARNLRELDVTFPIGRLTAVTGVSGSGKSTLVREVTHRALRRALGLKAAPPPGSLRSITGFEPLTRSIEVDQSPIGRTPRSVPATYVGIWGEVRKLLSKTPEARSRGWGPERFSFNREGGRCELCAGQGAVKVEMSFLPDVQATCEACGGTRFERATRQVTYRGLSVDRILSLTAEEARAVFDAVPKIAGPLELLCDLGLGYLTLGQPSNTLSGGEAQRLKLVAELRSRASRSFYVLDEPTTGLHAGDVERLVGVLERLVDRGDTVVVIEHHLDVIWAADHVIDLGPEGGAEGGEVVMTGPPPALLDHQRSHTAEALRRARGRAG